jgi:Ser/Thr protein kinase RdoA (MazF antagonist)
VVADGRAWVLRILLPPVEEAALDWEHAALARLAEVLPEVRAPVPSVDGATWFRAGERTAWLMPFAPGERADPARPPDREAAAAALGRVHAAGAALRLPPHPSLPALDELTWPEATAPEPLADHAAEIAAAREWAIAFVGETAHERRPRTGLVHGDFFPGNVLVDGGSVTVIDWEEARIDWLTWDLANAVGTFCFAGDDLDRPAARGFVDAYREAGGTAPPEEEDLLVPLMRAKRILEVLRAPADRDPRWEHQRHNLRALRNLA